MNRDNRNTAAGEVGKLVTDMAKDTALGLAHIVGVILASGVAGTILGAGACLWYGAPFGLALVGGVLGIVLALIVLYAAYDAF